MVVFPTKVPMMRSLLSFLVEYPVVVGTFFAVLFAALRLLLLPQDRKRTEWFLAVSALAMFAGMVCEGVAMWLSRFAPYKLDLYVFRIDGLFGVQPSFWMGRFVSHHFWLEIAANMAYNALPCAFLIVFAAYLWNRPAPETLAVLRTFILNLFLAVPIYLLVPVCGPVFAFPGFPLTDYGNLTPHAIALIAPPNGIPSVHTSTALLIVWFSWRWKFGRIISLLYLALIIVATLGSGQHYLFDLLTAVPYGALILSLGRYEWRLRVSTAPIARPTP